MVNVEIKKELFDELNSFRLAKPGDVNTALFHLIKKVKGQAKLPSVPAVEPPGEPAPITPDKLTVEELTSILEELNPQQISLTRKIIKKKRYTKNDIADFLGALSGNQFAFLRDELCKVNR